MFHSEAVKCYYIHLARTVNAIGNIHAPPHSSHRWPFLASISIGERAPTTRLRDRGWIPSDLSRIERFAPGIAARMSLTRIRSTPSRRARTGTPSRVGIRFRSSTAYTETKATVWHIRFLKGIENHFNHVSERRQKRHLSLEVSAA